MLRQVDGSAGDANYGRIGEGYSRYRRAEPLIERLLTNELSNARSILNVGAGAGSYEPTNRLVTAVEPSASMRAQRPQSLSPAIDAIAEDLPFPENAFDGSMASFTVHQWKDLEAGLAEMRRVTRGHVVVLTCDPAALDRSWLAQYASEMIAVESSRYPSIEKISRGLGSATRTIDVPIPLYCSDGFSEAYYGRPEALLDPDARRANSAWSFVDPQSETHFVEKLEHDLKNGIWDRHYGHLRTQPFFNGSLRLIVSDPKPAYMSLHRSSGLE